MLRLFISANLPPEMVRAIADVQNQLKRRLGQQPLSWTRPDGIHLTLKFLGDTDPARVESIVAGLRAAVSTHPPFTLTVAGLGCFPNARQPNVIWVGVQDPDRALQRLAASVDAATARLGWEKEKRPFTGHLTLARVKREAGNDQRRIIGEAIGEAIGSFPLAHALGPLPVSAIHLMRSELNPSGSIYTELASAPLARAAYSAPDPTVR